MSLTRLILLPEQDLLSVVFVRYGKFLTSFCTACSKNTTTVLGCHSLTEPVFVHPFSVVWLKCSFHFPYVLFMIISFTNGHNPPLLGCKITHIFLIGKEL